MSVYLLIHCWSPAGKCSEVDVTFRCILSNIAEKLLRPLQTHVLPVVYGSHDVHKVVPPHSYIDVRDFKSPQHLAQYLLYLNNNHTEYMSYFLWKKHYEVSGVGPKQKPELFCKFCKYLYVNNMTKILKDFKKWFFEEARCNNTELLSYQNRTVL